MPVIHLPIISSLPDCNNPKSSYEQLEVRARSPVIAVRRIYTVRVLAGIVLETTSCVHRPRCLEMRLQAVSDSLTRDVSHSSHLR